MKRVKVLSPLSLKTFRLVWSLLCPSFAYLASFSLSSGQRLESAYKPARPSQTSPDCGCRISQANCSRSLCQLNYMHFRVAAAVLLAMVFNGRIHPGLSILPSAKFFLALNRSQQFLLKKVRIQ